MAGAAFQPSRAFEPFDFAARLLPDRFPTAEASMRAVLVALAVMVSGAAWAGEGDFPMFPVEQRCKAHTMSDKLAYADCIRLEQHAYDRANYLRTDVSDEDRAYCASLATNAKAMNYMILNECYEGKLFIARNKAEMKALKDGPAPKFKY